MTPTAVEIAASEGPIDAFLCVGPGREPRPGVIYLIDIGGIRESQVARADRLAQEGFTVLVPNLCYRTRRPPLFDFPRNMKEERSQRRMKELVAPLTPEAVARDASLYVDWLSARPEVAVGPLGVVGHCFSGAIALRMAAARPDRIGAVASFHGGGLATDAPTSPHLLLPQVRAELYFGHAIEDASMPPEAIARLEHALKAWGRHYTSQVYEGAHHGWTAEDSAAYNAPLEGLAFDAMVELFRRALG
jgi:carboxymethylenebutenolidase